jgi:cold shock CspA family protein
MNAPLQITFHNTRRSARVGERIRERADKLEYLYGEIISARVVIDVPQRRHRKGRVFQVRIDVSVPGRELVVNREPLVDHSHEDVYVAIEDAFNAMERRVQDYIRELRGEVKRNARPEHGIVARLFREEGYGFIRTGDNRDVYFHQNSVLNGAFNRLRQGMEVRFAEEQGDKGPQASTVEIAGTTRLLPQ